MKVVLDYKLSSNENKKFINTGKFFLTNFFKTEDLSIPNPEII